MNGEGFAARMAFGVLALALVLGVALRIAGAMAKANLARRRPAPGRLVDVGGYVMHLNCADQGRATVIPEAGLNDFSIVWTQVKVGKYAGRWLEIRSHYLNGPLFGGLVGTARGFGKFLQDQFRQRSALLNEMTQGLLYTPEETTQGTAVAMTLGWHVADLEGTRFFYKEGFIA